MTDLLLAELQSDLARDAESADSDPVWPAASWAALVRAGVLTWSLPAEVGGEERSTVELLAGYEQLASSCLTTAFILSQREAACRRLRDTANSGLRREMLPSLASGEKFATVGLSQLTTSRQHTRPAMTARQSGERWILDGVMPWVTGAARADYFITGAVLPDGRQILAVVPSGLQGLSVGPPLNLMALRGSLTAEVRCREVALEERWLLAGPAPQVMSGKSGGTGGLETSCLALGLAKAAITWLQDESHIRKDLSEVTGALQEVLDRSRQEMLEMARSGASPAQAAQLRARANSLVLRSTQVALTAGKGAGFVHPHPTQRWARQALFFLVWSCPRPAAEATLAYLTRDVDEERS
jgi:alkylation response protein AidB-like acyl-CoA dehydrogenase